MNVTCCVLGCHRPHSTRRLRYPHTAHCTGTHTHTHTRTYTHKHTHTHTHTRQHFICRRPQTLNTPEAQSVRTTHGGVCVWCVCVCVCGVGGGGGGGGANGIMVHSTVLETPRHISEQKHQVLQPCQNCRAGCSILKLYYSLAIIHELLNP
jgi:hypothetical protein